ncbi:MAG: 3-dehydroquinate synthase [Verrucomicrobia bacterium]|nr:MAG: 3-dehydroquinate synthase [Verrucomicrobiota bacterium]
MQSGVQAPEPLQVDLGDRNYNIFIESDATASVKQAIDLARSEGRRVALVVDATVAGTQSAFLDALGREIPCFEVPSGEKSKSLGIYGRLLNFLAANHLDRQSLVVALGGGVVGDLAGFAAASYLRGIDFLNVPTTLLSMVDSSVGGKTGINLDAGKNLVGFFHQPRGVFIGTSILETLSKREFASGMAEVIKCGMLDDEELFRQLERAPALTPGSSALAGVIHRCCVSKVRIVKADEREMASSGGRALLNLGHTFAHAIENVAGYGTYLHGEAVAIGLVGATRLSVALGRIEASDVNRVERVLIRHALPTSLRDSMDVDRLIEAMRRDKKVRGGAPRFVVLKAVGTAETVDGVDIDLVAQMWRQLGAT